MCDERKRDAVKEKNRLLKKKKTRGGGGGVERIKVRENEI